MTTRTQRSEHSTFSGHEKTNAVIRVLGGEPVEKVGEEFGVSVRRLERWKSEFVTAGSAELSRRKDLPKEGWFGSFEEVKQWIAFLIVLAIVIGAVVYLQNR